MLRGMAKSKKAMQRGILFEILIFNPKYYATKRNSINRGESHE